MGILDRIWLTTPRIFSEFNKVVYKFLFGAKLQFPREPGTCTMEHNMTDFQNWFSVSQWYLYSGAWRFLLSLLIVLLGIVIARKSTKAVRRVVSLVTGKQEIVNSPLGLVLEPLLTLRGSGIFSSVTYAIVLFVFIAWAGEIVGITLFGQIIGMIVAYIPNVLVAVIILMTGMLLSSVVERLIKQQFKKVASHQAVLAGTIGSSVTIIMFVLMALSELGIASNFILIVFGGFVFALSLAAGIALGWGAKDLVAQSLDSMVTQEQKRRARTTTQKPNK